MIQSEECLVIRLRASGLQVSRFVAKCSPQAMNLENCSNWLHMALDEVWTSCICAVQTLSKFWIFCYIPLLPLKAIVKCLATEKSIIDKNNVPRANDLGNATKPGLQDTSGNCWHQSNSYGNPARRVHMLFLLASGDTMDAEKWLSSNHVTFIAAHIWGKDAIPYH